MPSVTVVLKTGHETTIEGANDAAWVHENLAPSSDRTTLILMVYYKETNKTEIRGKFRGEDVAGFTIDIRP